MAVTAKKDNMRLIAIVLGEKEGKIRNSETMDLLNYGFENYKLDMIKSKDEVIDNIKISKGNINSINIYLKDDLTIINKKSNKDIKYDYKITMNDIKLPIKKGDVVGKVDLLSNNNIIKSNSLIVKEDVYKINYLKYLLNKLLYVI